LEIIRTEQRGQTINTSYVESRNGNRPVRPNLEVNPRLR
jgi:hypothetical protein